MTLNSKKRKLSGEISNGFSVSKSETKLSRHSKVGENRQRKQKIGESATTCARSARTPRLQAASTISPMTNKIYKREKRTLMKILIRDSIDLLKRVLSVRSPRTRCTSGRKCTKMGRWFWPSETVRARDNIKTRIPTPWNKVFFGQSELQIPNLLTTL